jgi:hypothetical protein
MFFLRNGSMGLLQWDKKLPAVISLHVRLPTVMDETIGIRKPLILKLLIHFSFSPPKSLRFCF